MFDVSKQSLVTYRLIYTSCQPRMKSDDSITDDIPASRTTGIEVIFSRLTTVYEQWGSKNLVFILPTRGLGGIIVIVKSSIKDNWSSLIFGIDSLNKHLLEEGGLSGLPA